jgi:protein SCO1
MRHRASAIAVVSCVLASWLPGEPAAQSRHWGEDYFPNLPVVTHEGKTLRFYDDLIKDKIVVINFIYTSCPDVCPLTSARMAQVQQQLGELVGTEVFLYSISVDPAVDTPEVLERYAAAFGAGPGWLFITGDEEELRAARYSLGERRQSLNEHTQEVRLGNDATGEWQRAGLLGDLDSLVLMIRAMDPAWRNQERVIAFNPASNTGYLLPDRPGQTLFRRLCAPCHTIGVGDRIGPDLNGITSRRDLDWLARYIQDPVGMRGEGDTIALDLRDRFPAVMMPFLGVLPTDAEELIEYMADEEARLADLAAPANGAPHDHHSRGAPAHGAGHNH